MRLFFAVVKDLLQFALFYRVEIKPELPSESDTLVTPKTVSVPNNDQPVLLEQSVAIALPSPKSTGDLKLTEQIFNDEVVMYVREATVNIFLVPQWQFDSVIAKLRYGEAVVTLCRSEQFTEVRYGDVRGYIETKQLTSDYASIFPSLSAGKVYLATDKVTKGIRQILQDEFFAENLYLPLLNVEYVSYQLRLQNKQVPWGTKRPRTAGTWQVILRGLRTVRIGVVPKTNAIMEYQTLAGQAKIAWVESVSPEETLLICEVGAQKAGEYTESVLTKDHWLERKPVFIQLL